MTCNALERIAQLRLVPVIEIPDPSAAAPLGAALERGGLPLAEITFRTASAAESIARVRDACPGVIVGAGTVLTIEHVDAALTAGAEFLVAPGLNPRVVEYALARGATMIPGVCTPSEIELALGLGLTTLKFFPAEVAGGVAFLKAVAPVYSRARFIPTGGIGPENVASYLALPTVTACGGSWMVKKDLIAGACFDEIERRVTEAAALARADVAATQPAVPGGVR